MHNLLTIKEADFLQHEGRVNNKIGRNEMRSKSMNYYDTEI